MPRAAVCKRRAGIRATRLVSYNARFVGGRKRAPYVRYVYPEASRWGIHHRRSAVRYKSVSTAGAGGRIYLETPIARRRAHGSFCLLYFCPPARLPRCRYRYRYRQAGHVESRPSPRFLHTSGRERQRFLPEERHATIVRFKLTSARVPHTTCKEETPFPVFPVRYKFCARRYYLREA